MFLYMFSKEAYCHSQVHKQKCIFKVVDPKKSKFHVIIPKEDEDKYGGLEEVDTPDGKVKGAPGCFTRNDTCSCWIV